MSIQASIGRLISRLRGQYVAPAGTTHVIQYQSPLLLELREPGEPGTWEIQTLANYEAGTPADCPPFIEGGTNIDLTTLFDFAASVVGYHPRFVYFYDDVELADDPDAGCFPAPGYYTAPWHA